MICKKCEHMIVLHAFSEGQCEICDCTVVTGHIPCDKLCETCSESNNKCRSCSIDLDNKDGDIV